MRYKIARHEHGRTGAMTIFKLFDTARAATRVAREALRRPPVGVREEVGNALDPNVHREPPKEFPRPPARSPWPRVRSDERAIGWRDRRPPVPLRSPVPIVALYVTPAEDMWRQVTRARPQFDGHVQPRLPADLGFHEPANALPHQVALARQYGIDAFCFDLAPEADAGPPQPIERFLADGSLDLSFCVRIAAATACAALPRVLRDGRCLRVDGKPFVVVTGDTLAEAVRRACREGSVGEVLLGRLQSEDDGDPRVHGFDLAIVDPMRRSSRSITARHTLLDPQFRGEVFDWRERTEARPVAYPTVAMVNVGFDDEPSKPASGRVFAHASPRRYGEWLERAIAEGTRSSWPVLVDAWNDWPRGAFLEPDARLGFASLEATRDAIVRARGEHIVPRDLRPCAVVHAYHLELLDEIATALQRSGLDLRLVVTTSPDRLDQVRARLDDLGLSAEIEPHENRGRDLLPFLRVANRLLDEGVALVLKLHTKHSGHRTDGDAWRAQLIGRLIEPSRAEKIVNAFSKDPSLGCVAPEGHVLPLGVYWGWNEDTVRYLCVRMGTADPDTRTERFAAGSMVWVRLAALRPLLDAHLGEWEFEPEGGYVDGTMAHAVERALSLAVVGAGYRLDTAARVCELPQVDEGAYPFAQASHPTR